MGPKTKIRAKVSEATSKRNVERRANNRRAAWNRIGSLFKLPKELLEEGESSGLNPYRILKDKTVTREQARSFVQFGSSPEQSCEYDQGDHAIDRELLSCMEHDDIELDFFN